ncbi:SIDT1 [Bugula neritina]|uniref:SIDT1 n=1 Tax=Bugula neritina TaxID=10212 RepID=A0A7J7K4A7_BUGNE|nr:SIDT1 [Bugula neritina]
MNKPEEERERLGIPQHVGIFYAMGLALFVEGIMSGCYHVCPSYNNFQFDTAFMYILGGLLTLRLFQSRHPDINANAHTAFISLAIIIIIAVVGVLFNSSVFWYVFTFFYLLSVIYLSIKNLLCGAIQVW